MDAPRNVEAGLIGGPFAYAACRAARRRLGLPDTSAAAEASASGSPRRARPRPRPRPRSFQACDPGRPP